MIGKDKVIELTEQILKGTEHFLVDLVIQPGNRINVYIDGDHDVAIGHCREISKKIEVLLDRENEDFELTVSSSGIDRPLKFIRQYRKNIGRNLFIVTYSGSEISGKLVNVEDSGIEIEPIVKNPKKEKVRENTKIQYEEIKTARIQVSFRKQ